MAKMTKSDAQAFYADHKGKPFYEDLCNYICSDFVVGLELICEDSINRWRDLIGPTNSL